MTGVRRLGNWIETYQEYTEILPSPLLFRKWVAIFFIAAAMERRLWIRSMGSQLYPNLYVFLVGPPGVGKGQSIYLGESMLRNVPDLHVGPSDMTTASMIDSLNDAIRRVIVRGGNPPVLEYNSLTVISRELGVLIPGWETSLMNNLTDIYDGFTVDQRRRGKDLRIKIPAPQINLLGACTPAYLNDVMPPSAWDQGFISRTFLIYSGDRLPKDPFEEDNNRGLTQRLHTDLLHDLKAIALDQGQMKFTTPAAAAVKEWIKQGYAPEPQHQRLLSYNARRLAHLLKLCMISSMSRSAEKMIGIENYQEAFEWLIEAERYMPDIFKSMVTGGDSAAMEETWHYAFTIYEKERKPIQEHRLVHFLRERVPAHAVMRVLEIMVKGRMLEIITDGSGGAGYKPTSRAVRSGLV